ncbi:hypothetical protein I553_9907 [Mycobacterium xenopi 4042]|uniref:Uncharacterized protein n=1 Tax=Mycobacterium xenopi 4042 TaxID=1299334 RepID=X7YR42_MYCXE|nr:hypothetical protein I553_9907 [Mycobacterium xenopi 4042]
MGFSGLTEIRQESLFSDLDLFGVMSAPDQRVDTSAEMAQTAAWRIGDDVKHRELGHGWVQGAGHGVVTVRFETRSSGPDRRAHFPSTAASSARQSGRQPRLAGVCGGVVRAGGR